MGGVYHIAQQHVLVAIGLVEISLSELLDHHALLDFYSLGREVEARHSVAFEPEGCLDVGHGKGDVEVRIVVVGEGVILAAGHLYGRVEVGHEVCATKHQVFEQMRQTGAAW